MDRLLGFLIILCCSVQVSSIKIERVSETVGFVGESGVWDICSQTELWVDISAGVINRHYPLLSKMSTVKTETVVSFAVPRCNGEGLVIAQGNRVDFLRNDGFQVPFVTKEALGLEEGFFTNDGKADPAGRLWFGTLPTVDRPISELPSRSGLYSVNCQGEVTQHLNNLTVSNGMDWTQDKKTFLLVDTLKSVVYAFDYDMEKGEISNQRPFIQVPGLLPDGLTLDADDNVWVAFFGGGMVVQYDFQTGQELQRIDFSPVTLTTCPNFGGRNLDVLYVTTGRSTLTPEEAEQQPDAGALFKVTGLGVKGRPVNFFSG